MQLNRGPEPHADVNRITLAVQAGDTRRLAKLAQAGRIASLTRTDPPMPSPLLAPITRFAGRLRFPTLFAITAALFVVNVLVPDPIPFVDEILLALGTLLLGSLRRRGRRDPADTRGPK